MVRLPVGRAGVRESAPDVRRQPRLPFTPDVRRPPRLPFRITCTSCLDLIRVRDTSQMLPARARKIMRAWRVGNVTDLLDRGAPTGFFVQLRQVSQDGEPDRAQAREFGGPAECRRRCRRSPNDLEAVRQRASLYSFGR